MALIVATAVRENNRDNEDCVQIANGVIAAALCTLYLQETA